MLKLFFSNPPSRFRGRGGSLTPSYSKKTMASALPESHGLYDPAQEHDACGIGAVVNISGRREHAIVEHGKQVLLNLQHRGAAGADESTGDGAGILRAGSA